MRGRKRQFVVIHELQATSGAFACQALRSHLDLTCFSDVESGFQDNVARCSIRVPDPSIERFDSLPAHLGAGNDRRAERRGHETGFLHVIMTDERKVLAQEKAFRGSPENN